MRAAALGPQSPFCYATCVGIILYLAYTMTYDSCCVIENSCCIRDERMRKQITRPITIYKWTTLKPQFKLP